jgi:hypothetical protein
MAGSTMEIVERERRKNERDIRGKRVGERSFSKTKGLCSNFEIKIFIHVA